VTKKNVYVKKNKIVIVIFVKKKSKSKLKKIWRKKDCILDKNLKKNNNIRISLKIKQKVL
jgi:hypothetical protein